MILEAANNQLKFNGNKVHTESYNLYIPSNLISEKRLDCDYYSPTFVRNQDSLLKSGFTIKTIGDLSEELSDGTHDTIELLGGYQERGIRYISSGEVANGFDAKGVFIPEKAHIRNKRSEVLPGDLLIAVRGSSSIGMSRIYPLDWPPANINTAVARIRFKDNSVYPYWVSIYLNSHVGRLIILRIANGVNQLNINMSELSSIDILLPPYDIQKAIGNKLRKAEQLKELSLRTWNNAIKEVEKGVGTTLDLNTFQEFSKKTINHKNYKCVSTNPVSIWNTVKNELGVQYYHPRRINAQNIASSTGKWEKLSNLAKRIKKNSSQENSGISDFIGLDAINSATGTIDIDSIDKNSDASPGAFFKQKDILFSRLRPYLNKVAIWPETWGNGCGSRGAIGLSSKRVSD